MNKFFVKVTVLTAGCFLASWLVATLNGVNKVHAYPQSLVKAYAAVSGSNVEVKKSFSGKSLNEIVIETSATDVRVERGASDFVELELAGSFPTGHDPLMVELNEKKIEIAVQETAADGDFRFNLSFSEDQGGLRVRIPENITRITVKTISGDTALEQIMLQELAVKTTSGDLSLSEAGVRELIFQSTSGDLDAGEVDVAKFSGKTVSGDMELELLNDAPELDASSVSGDLGFDFRQREASLKVSFSTVSGDAEVKTGKSIPPGTNEFVLGGGQGSLRAKTVSGDLFIRGL